MPPWITLATTILNAVIQIVKLIIELNKKDPQQAKAASDALRCARKEGDASKLQDLVNQLKKEGAQ